MTPDEFTSLSARMDRHEKSQDRLASSHEDMRQDIAGMRIELTENTEVTTEVRDLLTKAKGFFSVAGVIGSAAKWILGVAASAAALWAGITHWGKP